MGEKKPLSSSAIVSAKKRAVFRFLFIQFLSSILLSMIIFIVADGYRGYSFLFGALCSIIPSFYMAWRIFGHKGVRQAKEVVKSFYRGEASKLVLTAVLLSLAFLLIKPLSAGFFLAGFVIAILSHWLSPILLKH